VHHKSSYDIAALLKGADTVTLFTWIGKCIAESIDVWCEQWGLISRTLPGVRAGVSYSFPML
jgi:hypothetical protein